MTSNVCESCPLMKYCEVLDANIAVRKDEIERLKHQGESMITVREASLSQLPRNLVFATNKLLSESDTFEAASNEPDLERQSQLAYTMLQLQQLGASPLQIATLVSGRVERIRQLDLLEIESELEVLEPKARIYGAVALQAECLTGPLQKVDNGFLVTQCGDTSLQAKFQSIVWSTQEEA